MKIEEQIEMVKLMRDIYHKEAKIWKDPKMALPSDAAAESCEIFANACSEILQSLLYAKLHGKK